MSAVAPGRASLRGFDRASEYLCRRAGAKV